MATRPALPDGADEIDAEWMRQALAVGGSSGFPTVSDLSVEDLGSATNAFGTLLRCRLTAGGGAPAAPASVIVKLPTADPTAFRFARWLAMHERECRFYRRLARQAPHPVPGPAVRRLRRGHAPVRARARGPGRPGGAGPDRRRAGAGEARRPRDRPAARAFLGRGRSSRPVGLPRRPRAPVRPPPADRLPGVPAGGARALRRVVPGRDAPARRGAGTPGGRPLRGGGGGAPDLRARRLPGREHALRRRRRRRLRGGRLAGLRARRRPLRRGVLPGGQRRHRRPPPPGARGDRGVPRHRVPARRRGLHVRRLLARLPPEHARRPRAADAGGRRARPRGPPAPRSRGVGVAADGPLRSRTSTRGSSSPPPPGSSPEITSSRRCRGLRTECTGPRAVCADGRSAAVEGEHRDGRSSPCSGSRSSGRRSPPASPACGPFAGRRPPRVLHRRARPRDGPGGGLSEARRARRPKATIWRARVGAAGRLLPIDPRVEAGGGFR